uniref:Uncharacterized protein n=1 Tax=viral metagenome TaxID=1070528 RepID=A0A6C0D2H9_9ZZZZ
MNPSPSLRISSSSNPIVLQDKNNNHNHDNHNHNNNDNNNNHHSSSDGPFPSPPVQIINNYFGATPSSPPQHDRNHRNHRNHRGDDYSCLRPVYMPIGCNGISSQIMGYVETPCQDPEERILTLPSNPYYRPNYNFIHDFPTIYENVCPDSYPDADAYVEEVTCPNVCPVYSPIKRYRNRYTRYRYR